MCNGSEYQSQPKMTVLASRDMGKPGESVGSKVERADRRGHRPLKSKDSRAEFLCSSLATLVYWRIIYE